MHIFLQIWLSYKRQTGGRVAVHSWPTTSSMVDDLPDYFVPSSGFSHPLEEQLDQVTQWLSLPSSTRPGLVVVSNDDLVRTLQKEGSGEAVANVLDRIDRTLDSFFSRLLQANILGCVNIAIVSDQ
ncbi:hypothetical protein COOONC_16039, partial [Cooperia oncophora]